MSGGRGASVEGDEEAGRSGPATPPAAVLEPASVRVEDDHFFELSTVEGEETEKANEEMSRIRDSPIPCVMWRCVRHPCCCCWWTEAALRELVRENEVEREKELEKGDSARGEHAGESKDWHLERSTWRRRAEVRAASARKLQEGASELGRIYKVHQFCCGDNCCAWSNCAGVVVAVGLALYALLR
jgi:hypothetical protein